MPDGWINLPMGINPKTGKKKFTDSQLAYLKPRWKRQWERYSDLSDDIIDELVNTWHTGPFNYPGTRITKATTRGMNKEMTQLAMEYKRDQKWYTGRTLYREARKRFMASVRKTNAARDREDNDPAGVMSKLTAKERKKRMNMYDVR